ncbi:MAG: T9SS type A sorting domain-containing protein [Bacteroidota bacterium]|nr:T9SS type A sorting domain-containing protein [Bacteroidota bacterium]
MSIFKKFFILTLIIASITAAQEYPYRTIKEIQENPLDSLLVADQLQNTTPSRWTLQSCNFLGDTVKVVGVCIIPPKVMNYTTFGYNFVIADTNYDGPFGCIFIRPAISSTTNPGDTAFYQGILNIEKGDIVEVVGRVWDFPGPGESGYPTMNSMSQIVPLKDPNFTIIGKGDIPPIHAMSTSDFYEGIYVGKIKFSTGEPYESGYVELTNLTVVGTLNQTNGTVHLVDDYGNQISTYDASKWWTLRGHRDPNSPYKSILPIYTRIDTIRGWITTVSGGENPRGYRIAPIETTDVVVGISRPSITTVRRYPVIVMTDSSTKIEAVIKPGPSGVKIINRFLHYSINDGPFNIDTMKAISGDTSYQGIIPIQSIGTTVKYFLKATDSLGNSTISANGSGGGLGSDTSKGFYFFKVTDGNLTIHDVQYTPYTNGRSAYVGAVTTIRGIVTADTNDIGLNALNTGGTPVWYMQTGNEPANGIWFNGTLDTLKSLQKGDSVAITGSVQENYDVTRIGNITGMEILTTGNTIPEPVKLLTGQFGPSAGNGNLNAEPWEGMLIEFDTVTVTNVWPTYADVTEYTVSDGSGEIIIRRDGKNTFSNVPNDTIYPGTTIIKVGDKFVGLKGIIFYSFNRYKICPRTNSDFGTYISVGVSEEISGQLPLAYQLANNYPNPFNPKTVIEYSLPQTEMVTIKVFNVLGQEVAKLKNEVQRAGRYRVSFDASHLATGLYFYRLQTPNFVQVKKMILVK